MEKLYSNPYDNPALVKVYEKRYIHHPFVQDDICHEIKAIKNIAKSLGYKSWCDVGCGTAYHLRKTELEIVRSGIDRSSTMLEQHKNDTVYDVNYILCDFLEWQETIKFDLVTNFWFGYAHQPTLNLVLKFLDKLVAHTEKNGSVLVSLHNQWKIFDKHSHKTDEPMGGTFLLDAMHWSYAEPETGDIYECIVPHKKLVEERLSRYFSNVRYLPYPRYMGKELLFLEGKN